MISVSSRTNQPSVQVKTKKKQKVGVLTAYTKCPDIEFNIDEFETYAISRLNVLRWIEKQTGLGRPIADTLQSILMANNLHIPLNDEISHFIGRLCFCQTIERRRWFLQTEKLLFEARYKTAQSHDKTTVHQQLCGGTSTYELITKQMIMNDEDLNDKRPIPKFKKDVKLKAEDEMLPFYKVPFEEVLTLVGRRNVYLLDGYAYVPNNKFFNLITGKFRSHLNKGLVTAQRAIDKMKQDPIAMDCVSRVIHIIDGLHKITNGPQYKINKNKSVITHKDVNKLSNIHFPLCMQSSLEHMRNDGHLKHGGRMHLGLFLKGIGLSLSEAMIYWRNSFTKIGADKFNKQYAYNVRHNYGKEGKRIDYTPYSCNKIISCTPNGGDFHGCPYKIFDHSNLRKYLAINKKMGSQDIEMIIGLVKNNHYQLACRSYFGAQHRNIMNKKGISIDNVDSQWSHPNEYFDNSYRIYHGDKKKEDEKKDMEDLDVNMSGMDMNHNHNNKENQNIQNNNGVTPGGPSNNGVTPGGPGSNGVTAGGPNNTNTNRFAGNGNGNRFAANNGVTPGNGSMNVD